MGASYSGNVQYFEYTKEEQGLDALILLSYALYDLSSHKILLKDTIEYDKRYTSLSKGNLMAVGQDSNSYGNVGPVKKIAASYRPQHVNQELNYGTTGPLPSSDSIREDLFSGVSLEILKSLEDDFF